MSPTAIMLTTISQCSASSHAEDIAVHLDGFVNRLHKSVVWGGFTIFGGPDEKGEVCIHMQILTVCEPLCALTSI